MPETTCCQLCNTISDVSACPSNYTRLFLDALTVGDVKNLLGEASMQIASLGAAIGLPQSFYTSTSAVVTWYLNASVSALNTLAGEDHSDHVGILQCSMYRDAGRASWYGQHHECLQDADRFWILSENTSEHNLNKSAVNAQASEKCACDVNARAWAESVVVLNVLALIGAVACVRAANLGGVGMGCGGNGSEYHLAHWCFHRRVPAALLCREEEIL